MAEIRTKAEFYKLWEAGLLGNKLRTWRDPAQAVADGVPEVGFRYSDPKGGGAPWWGTVKREGLVARYNEIVAQGFNPAFLVVCESAPDEKATIQGEVVRLATPPFGLRGYLGWAHGMRMRDSIKLGHLKPRTPTEVRALLETYMDPSSRDDLDALLDLYPDAAIEFTCYTVNCGAIPRRNTIFWEVRNY